MLHGPLRQAGAREKTGLLGRIAEYWGSLDYLTPLNYPIWDLLGIGLTDT